MKRKLKIVLLFIFLGIFVVSAFQLYGIHNNYEKGDAIYHSVQEQVVKEITVPEIKEKGKVKKAEKLISVDFSTLKKKNKDIVGWLYIPDTVICYPLLKGTDNETYLHQTYDKQSSIFGSIFMDFRNSSDLQDSHTLIYGHNMRNGSMFGSLKRYNNEADFYKKHKTIYILTEKATYRYQIFSYHVADVNGAIYTVSYDKEEDFEWFLKLAKESSYKDTGIDVSTKDKIITLSTCNNTDTTRFVVHGKYDGIVGE